VGLLVVFAPRRAVMEEIERECLSRPRAEAEERAGEAEGGTGVEEEAGTRAMSEGWGMVVKSNTGPS
jgi:hypothetical protein